MTKYEYLAKLEQLLAAMPPQERRDALDYYSEYFDAAGPDHEAETAEKLGDPETVARKILEGAGLNGAGEADQTVQAPQPASGNPYKENPAAEPITRTGLHGPGLLVLFIVILLLVALALVMSAAATGFRGFGRDSATSVVAQTPIMAEKSSSTAAQLPEAATPAPADSAAPAATSADSAANTQAASDWETTYSMNLTEVDLELSQINLTVVVDESVSAVILRGSGVGNDALVVDQKELDRDAKLDARLSANGAANASLTLVLPVDNQPRRMEFKLTGGSAVLPDLTLDELEVDSMGAQVTVSNITARKVDLTEEADGAVSAATLTADEISLDAARGAVSSTQVVVSRQLDVEAESGRVSATLQGQAADYRLEAENKGGTLTVNGEQINGEVHRQGNTNVSIEAECRSGSIELGFAG